MNLGHGKIFVAVSLIILIILSFLFFTRAPFSFVSETEIKIEEGSSLKEISIKLKDAKIIRSKSLFSSFATLFGYDKSLISGEYRFEKPIDVFKVLEKLHKGEYGFPVSSVTLYEGMTISEMAEQFSKVFPDFNSKEFKKKTIKMEGFLFPDTYFFRENVSVNEIIKTLRENFDQKIKENGLDNLKEDELFEIVIMASIIEKESTKEGRQEISNILWKRIDMDMPLQVDATFMYERGQGTFDLSLEDLKEDSLYNTYTRRGLPPTPIGNPGIESIKAAANPKETDNLYFLTGKDGEMYYAKNFEGHKRNKELYLR